MSLRGRLLAATMLAALIALAIVDVVTYVFVSRAQIDQVDQDLERAHPPIELAARSLDDDATAAIRAVAPASYVELRSAEGVTELVVPLVRAGESSIDLGHVELEPGMGGGDAPVFRTIELGHDNDVRVRVSRQDDGRTLIIGQSLRLVDRTRERLLVVLVAGTIGAILAVAVVGVWLVGIGLAPLAAIERAAAGVAEGDLDRRAPGASEETEVGRLADTINMMLDQLASAIRSREADVAALQASEARMRRFVADASHELRTPIAATTAYAELFDLGARDRPEDLERAMTGIRAETARMADLVSDLILLAELDEGRPFAREPVDIAKCAADAVQAARAVAPTHQVGLRVEDVVTVAGDAGRLRQVLDNLIGNVRAHTPPGTSCLVDIRRDGDEAVITVIDGGPGLDPDLLDSITDRFVRADASRTRASGGAGLGLSIVSSIVEAHGGTLRVENPPDGGLQVVIRLPLVADVDEPNTDDSDVDEPDTDDSDVDEPDTDDSDVDEPDTEPPC